MHNLASGGPGKSKGIVGPHHGSMKAKTATNPKSCQPWSTAPPLGLAPATGMDLDRLYVVWSKREPEFRAFLPTRFSCRVASQTAIVTV